MSIFSENIRYLRTQRKVSQQSIADSLVITRGRYAKYEDGTNEPPIEVLLKISKYYKISIDLLLTVDLQKYPLEEMLSLPDNRILLPVKVDAKGNNQIEIIPQKASMGYLEGYTDPGYIDSLQTISLPFLRNGKYRAFPASGDSMPPFKDGTFIVGKYVESIHDLKPGKTYIFITLDEGVVYKRFQSVEENGILISSDNPLYQPYTIDKNNLVESWEYACSISTKDYDADEFKSQTVYEMFSELKTDIKIIKERVL